MYILSVTAMLSFRPARPWLPPSQTQSNGVKGPVKVRARNSGEVALGLKDGQSLTVDLHRGQVIYQMLNEQKSVSYIFISLFTHSVLSFLQNA